MVLSEEPRATNWENTCNIFSPDGMYIALQGLLMSPEPSRALCIRRYAASSGSEGISWKEDAHGCLRLEARRRRAHTSIYKLDRINPLSRTQQGNRDLFVRQHDPPRSFRTTGVRHWSRGYKTSPKQVNCWEYCRSWAVHYSNKARDWPELVRRGQMWSADW